MPLLLTLNEGFQKLKYIDLNTPLKFLSRKRFCIKNILQIKTMT